MKEEHIQFVLDKAGAGYGQPFPVLTYRGQSDLVMILDDKFGLNEAAADRVVAAAMNRAKQMQGTDQYRIRRRFAPNSFKEQHRFDLVNLCSYHAEGRRPEARFITFDNSGLHSCFVCECEADARAWAVYEEQQRANKRQFICDSCCVVCYSLKAFDASGYICQFCRDGYFNEARDTAAYLVTFACKGCDDRREYLPPDPGGVDWLKDVGIRCDCGGKFYALGS